MYIHTVELVNIVSLTPVQFELFLHEENIVLYFVVDETINYYDVFSFSRFS